MRVPISNLKAGTALNALLADPRLLELQKILGENVELYPVGGTVRDCLLNKQVKDLDLATNLGAKDALTLLEKHKIRVIATGLHHQTITALPYDDQDAVEITTFRAGRILNDSSNTLHTIESDLAYRDFTTNALALDPRTKELIDVSGGIEDLEKRILRAVDDPEKRFSEDPLRTLRMIRLACVLGFEIEKETKEAAKKFADKLTSVSIERIRDEFAKMLLSSEPARAMDLLVELCFMQHIVPELLASVDFEQNKYHKEDVFKHTLAVVSRTSSNLELRLAALLHDVAKPDTLSVDAKGERHFFQHERVGAKMTKNILRRLKFSNTTIKNVETLVYTHMRPLEAGPGGLRRLLRDTEELFPLWRELKEADAGACKIDSDTLKERLATFDAAIEEVRKGPQVSPLKSLAINGDDLIALGLKPSQKFKEILQELHEMVLDDPGLNDRDKLLEIVKARFL